MSGQTFDNFCNPYIFFKVFNVKFNASSENNPPVIANESKYRKIPLTLCEQLI